MITKIPRLFEILNERDITQRKLAESIGASTGNISDWKSGKSSPSIDALPKIAEFLNCSVDYLLGLTENPQAHIKSTETNNELVTLIAQLTQEQQELVAAQIKGILLTKKNPQPKGDG